MAHLDLALSGLRDRARRFAQIESCLTEVGVVRRGDPRHRWGYQYDERDHSGLDLRPALALAREQRSDWRLLDLHTSRQCLSRPTKANGSGEDARVAPAAIPPLRTTHDTPRPLLPWITSLELVADQIRHQATRFDRWQSCLTALPVTEAGAAWQRLGYLSRRPPYRAAIDLDTSEWDDPDYQLLAFPDRARADSRGACDADPSEAVDRTRPASSSRTSRPDLRERVDALREDVEDLHEPVAEITQFDECVYTVGVRSSTGYSYQTGNGRLLRASALAFDIRGPRVAPLQLLVLPGEEPPQIECNEDASNAGIEE